MRESYKFEDDNLVITRTENIAPVLDACHDLRGVTPKTTFREDKLMHRIASIPAIVVTEWLKDGVDIFDTSPEMQKRIMAKLNGDYKYLKTVDAHL